MLERQAYAFSVRQTDVYCVVRAEGELDIASVAALRARVRGARRTASRVVVDLRDVTFMDSLAVLALVGLQREGDEDSHMHVVPGPHVQRVLDLTGARTQLRWISPEQLAA